MEEIDISKDTPENQLELNQKRILDLEKILEISCELTSSLRLEPLLKKIVETASELTGCEGSSILLIDDEKRDLRFKSTTILNSETLSGSLVPLKGSIAGEIYTTSQPITVYDVQSYPSFYREIDRLMGYKTVSLMGVPLKIKTRTIGVLETVNKKDKSKFTRSDVDTLVTLGSHAAIAIENARLYEQVLEHADYLEKKVQERTAELQERNQELIAYDHTVAHDLKNPLTVVIGFSRLLEQDYSTMSNSEIFNKLSGIRELGEKMLTIIDEILFLSGIRDKEVELKPLDMEKIVKSANKSLENII